MSLPHVIVAVHSSAVKPLQYAKSYGAVMVDIFQSRIYLQTL